MEGHFHWARQKARNLFCVSKSERHAFIGTCFADSSACAGHDTVAPYQGGVNYTAVALQSVFLSKK